ncbi:MAG: hypothetical protein ABJO09_16835 [Hyphomicrobiales bacterium]
MLCFKTKLQNAIQAKLFGLVFAGIFVVSSGPIALADVSTFECKALRQDAGREEADMASPLLRRADETLHVIEVGELYYSSFDPEVDDVSWLELYGAQSQRGNSFVGFFQFANFRCVSSAN